MLEHSWKSFINDFFYISDLICKRYLQKFPVRFTNLTLEVNKKQLKSLVRA